MPLAAVGQFERRQKLLAVGGVVDEQGRVVTCAAHDGGCRYRPKTIWSDLGDMIWAARTELPTEALARCIREVPGGGGAMNMEEISRYRASLPCEVVEIPEAEVKRRTASLAKEQARQEYARRNGLITRPDPRDAELAVMFPPRRPSSWLPDGLDETERLDRQQRHDARHAQWVREFDAWRQQHHTQDVREGYGDAVPDYEEA